MRVKKRHKNHFEAPTKLSEAAVEHVECRPVQVQQDENVREEAPLYLERALRAEACRLTRRLEDHETLSTSVPAIGTMICRSYPTLQVDSRRYLAPTQKVHSLALL